VYQAGTLSGNPVAVSAGLAMLDLLEAGRGTIYPYLDEIGAKVAEALRTEARNQNVPIVVNQVGSMVTAFFTTQEAVTDYADAKTSDTNKFAVWFRELLENGVYWPPSQFESAFLSAIMTEADTEHFAQAFGNAFAKVAANS
jgi:glutamate-1-semialdehyde 2,1-aminomutase